MAVYAENRRVRFDYEILETFESGIALKGFEVKAVKSGRVNLAGSFALLKPDGLWLMNADIPPYQPKNTPADYDQKRSRRLLVKREEMRERIGKAHSANLTFVPVKMYNKRGLVKVEIAVAKPRKKADRREAIKKRETKREISRTLKR